MEPNKNSKNAPNFKSLSHTPKKITLEKSDQLSNLKSESSETSVNLNFESHYSTTLLINWIGFDGKETNYITLSPNSSQNQQTFDTHVWTIRDKESSELKHVYRATNEQDQYISLGGNGICENRFLPWCFYEENQGLDCHQILERIERCDRNNSAFKRDPSEELKKFLQNSKFIDAELPRQDFIWKRVSEINKDICLYPEHGVSGCDIVQGSLGDCWFLQSLSSVAEAYPHKITAAISPKEINQNGFYTVKFKNLKDGSDSWILIDDYLPLKKKDYCPTSMCPQSFLNYTKCTNHFKTTSKPGIWVGLLEKAYAKLLGHYETMDAGKTPESCHDVLVRFLGGNSAIYTWEPNEVSSDDLWNRIKELFNDNKAISLSSSKTPDGELIYKGIVNYHGYSLFGIKEVTLKDGSKVKLVNVRNTWGKQCFDGDWHYDDKKWNENEHLIKELKYIREDNGVFWMNIDDFRVYFVNIWHN